MIEALHGRVVTIEPNRIVLNTGAIDFSCIVSTTASSFYDSIRTSEKDDITVYTYLYHKEDSMQLFGFSTKEEREMFFELIKVNGIGPKQAVKILSGITVAELVTALDQSDLDRLVRIPGLGTKTAQKLVLSLRNKLELFTEHTKNGSNIDHLPSICSEIIQALIDMGYERKQTKKVVVDTYQELSSKITNDKQLEEQLFKASIIKLA